jgi:hypothetical protein
MKPLIRAETLDRLNLCAIRLRHRNQAAIHQITVHQHTARAALSLAASFLRAGQLQIASQYVQQTRHRVRVHQVQLSIHA